MIYKFKSKAAGDVIMLQPHGDQLMRLIGREPAAKGIIEIGRHAGGDRARCRRQRRRTSRQPRRGGDGERGVGLQAARVADDRDDETLTGRRRADRLGRLTRRVQR